MVVVVVAVVVAVVVLVLLLVVGVGIVFVVAVVGGGCCRRLGCLFGRSVGLLVSRSGSYLGVEVDRCEHFW